MLESIPYIRTLSSRRCRRDALPFCDVFTKQEKTIFYNGLIDVSIHMHTLYSIAFWMYKKGSTIQNERDEKESEVNGKSRSFPIAHNIDHGENYGTMNSSDDKSNLADWF